MIAGAFDLALRGSAVAVALIGLSGILLLRAATGRKEAMTFAIIGLTAVDLGLQALPYASFQQVNDFLSQAAALVSSVRNAGREGRVLMLSRGDLARGPDLVRPGENAFIHYGVLGAGGFDSFEVSTYRSAIDSTTNGLRQGSPLLAAVYGVRYVVTDLPLQVPAFQPLEQLGPAKLYEIRDAFPRFYLTTKVHSVASPNEALGALAAQRPPVGKVVFIEGFVATPPEPAITEVERIEVLVSDPNRIVLRVRSAGGGMLVENETFYPGWVAEVDGAPTPILRANGLVRAIPVLGGSHTVEMRFVPRTLVLGAWISLFTVLFLLAAAVVATVGKRKGTHADRDARSSAAAT